jgi:hypothetical protein
MILLLQLKSWNLEICPNASVNGQHPEKGSDRFSLMFLNITSQLIAVIYSYKYTIHTYISTACSDASMTYSRAHYYHTET